MSAWLPPIATSAVIALALWFFRQLIATRLTASVKHEFDSKLESLRADSRERDELLNADLRAKENEIAALRSGALTAMTSRQMALDRRRLVAVDQLWSAATALGSLKATSAMLSTLNFDAVHDEAVKNSRMREAINAMSGGVEITNLDLTGAAKARPFVTPMVWAMYNAYQAIAMHAALKVYILKHGIGNKKLVSHEAVSALIKAALPHRSEYVDEHGYAGFHFLLDELETALLQAIRDMLAGADVDRAGISQAAEILHLAESVRPIQTTLAGPAD